MQSSYHNLGELRSVHRPATFHIWSLLVLTLFPLMLFLFGAFLALDAFTSQNLGRRREAVSNSFTCLGFLGLLLAVLGSVLVSDYRAWSTTRTVRLSIYEGGFTYESKGQVEACRWDEIKDIKFRFILSGSRAFPYSRVRVIRSVVKEDGTVISPAETLNLKLITELITAERKKP